MMENPNWKPTEEDIRFAWKVWIDENAKLETVPWLRAYANSIDPKYPVGMSGLATEILRRCQEAANDIERLRKLFGDSERLSGRLQETVDQLRERLGGMRIELDEAIRERDEARRVLKSIVEEFVQHAQTMNPLYPATPSHECQFSWNPESGKCDACEAWGDYVLICHPLVETEEEETP